MHSLPPPTARRGAAIALLLAAGALFGWRAVIRPAPKLYDFAICVTASRMWLDGENPYEHERLWQRWRDAAAHRPAHVPADLTYQHSLLPPSVFPLLAPFTLLPPRVAFPLWQWLSVAGVVAMTMALLSLAHIRWRESLGMVALAGVLLCGPVQSGVFVGQPAMPSIALAVLSVWCARRDRSVLAGVLAGVAAAMKVQIGVPVIFYHLCLGRMRTTVAAAACLVLIGTVGVARFELAGVAWVGAWLENLRNASAPGAPNSYVDSTSRDHLVNTQLPLYALTGRRAVTEAGTWLLFLALAVLWFIRRAPRAPEPALTAAVDDVRADADRRELLTFAAWSAVFLLPVYHRYYDASLLAAAGLWALSAVWRGSATSPWRVPAAAPAPAAALTLALLLPFALPVGFATTLLNAARLPGAWGAAAWWNILVRPLHAWLLAALAACLVWAMWRQPHSPAPTVD